MKLLIPAMLAAVVIAIVVTASASAAPDPLVGLLGAPTKIEGHVYFFKKCGTQKCVCRTWAFVSSGKVTRFVEDCLVVPAKSKKRGPGA